LIELDKLLFVYLGHMLFFVYSPAIITNISINLAETSYLQYEAMISGFWLFSRLFMQISIICKFNMQISKTKLFDNIKLLQDSQVFQKTIN